MKDLGKKPSAITNTPSEDKNVYYPEASIEQKLLPELKGKLNGFAIRVPTKNVSMVDLVCTLEKPATVSAVNEALKEAAEGPMKRILAYEEEELVSFDFMGTTVSSTVDSKLTMMIDDTTLKVIAWYDNEMGYSCRVVDLIEYISK